ncbi:MAG: acyl-CoA desaturase [Candidatus Levybacteria bacterium]|nr:acyl-CoA desaturase [Candidatus Levybacteria bacterium]
MANKLKQSAVLQRSSLKMSVVDGAKAYSELRQMVVKAGVLERSYGYYAVVTLIIFCGFGLSLYQLFVSNSYLLLTVWAIIFAFFSVQIGGLLHDAGHRAIFKSSKVNDIFGQIIATLILFSYGDWKTTHNNHHAHPNQDDHDPDIDVPLSFTDERYRNRKGLIAVLRKYQAYLYYPLGSFVLFRIRIKDFFHFWKTFGKRGIGERISFITALFLWFFLPFAVFDFPKALFLLLIVHIASGAYLLNVFAPNHKGMTELDSDVKISFLEQQIITARNIHGHWLTDLFYFGLNYQIEHHLFPNTPRNKLKLLTPYVKAICRKYRFAYTSVSILETNKIILKELHAVAKRS